jgi:ABC-type multidrug transport system permease subunit
VSAARAVADVPGAIVAAKHTNAQPTAKELIMIFVNFVFIVIFSFCLSFSCFGRLWLLVIELAFLAVHWCTP